MAGYRIGRGFFVALAGIGLLAAGSGVAHARPATVVLSDKIRFSGTAVAGSAPGTWSITTTNCTETSDGETTIYKCQTGGQIMKNAVGGFSGFLNLGSADGAVNWKFTLVKSSTPNLWIMRGAGSEVDNEGGVTTSYPAAMRGLVKLVPSGPNFLVTALVSVWESSTAP
jgi:hypothetical protein